MIKVNVGAKQTADSLWEMHCEIYNALWDAQGLIIARLPYNISGSLWNK